VIRTLLLLLVLGLAALVTPLPWAFLWLLIPAIVAIGLLACWRWALWGVLVPVITLAAVALLVGPMETWAWWIPAAALTGSWMGLREEGGGPASGERAWMMLPILLLAASLPWTLTYPEVVSSFDHKLQLGDRDVVQTSREIGYQGERLRTLERLVADGAAMRTRYLPFALPAMLFVWVASLVVAGRKLASQVASRLKWPDLSHGRLSDWRLPDGAIWLLIVGLGLLLAGFKGWLPSAWTLLIVPALGYCVQGMAVVQSLLIVRGVPSSIVILTLLFIVLMAFPVFLPATVCVGLSDIWLDYRRLETVADGDLS
jgi:hypothetical protein